MIEECVIIGGGIAGLSAANRLTELGISPLIIEGGQYPCHRICGEYFSHETFPILEKWGIPLAAKINRVCFIKDQYQFAFNLPISAAGSSHFDFDLQLFNRAINKGARALLKVTVISIDKKNDIYQLKLSNNQILKTRKIIIGVGKFPKIEGFKSTAPKSKYYGFKAHFEMCDFDEILEMYLFPKGYLGLAKVNPKTINIAALIRKDSVKNIQNPESYVQELIDNNSVLKKRMKDARILFSNWMVSEIPEFGIRNDPNLEGLYLIGDAAGGIPPICGEGLAIGLTSGYMAADYVLNSTSSQFKIEWLKRYKKRFFWAQLVHNIVLRPILSDFGIKICHAMPFIPRQLWQLTRE